LQHHVIESVIVDSASIEVDRRQRLAKTDRLDAGKLVSMLIRYHHGETRRWRVVRVPSEDEEMRRHLHRDLGQLKRDRTQHVNRIRGLLAAVGTAVGKVDATFVERLPALQDWAGRALPAALVERLRREWHRWQQVQEQIEALEHERSERVRTVDDKASAQVRTLLGLKAIGLNSSWLLVMEVLSWRDITDRRQLAGLAGLAPMPYRSGDYQSDQGISKAGNGQLRALLVEISWCWLRWQPTSALSRWFAERFGGGGKRHRRVGIVALARKLLVALWRYVDKGEVPEGAVLTDWQTKLAS
jgi:transposase